MKVESRADLNTLLIIGIVFFVMWKKDEILEALFNVGGGANLGAGKSSLNLRKGATGTDNLGYGKSETGSKSKQDNEMLPGSSIGTGTAKMLGIKSGAGTGHKNETKKIEGKYLILFPGTHTIQIPGNHPPRFDAKIREKSKYLIHAKGAMGYKIEFQKGQFGWVK